MIVQKQIIINDKKFIKSYSDCNYYIEQIETGELYDEAIDLITNKKDYIETTKLINDNIID